MEDGRTDRERQSKWNTARKESKKAQKRAYEVNGRVEMEEGEKKEDGLKKEEEQEWKDRRRGRT